MTLRLFESRRFQDRGGLSAGCASLGQSTGLRSKGRAVAAVNMPGVIMMMALMACVRRAADQGGCRDQHTTEKYGQSRHNVLPPSVDNDGVRCTSLCL
jgi:hypothetical protein